MQQFIYEKVESLKDAFDAVSASKGDSVFISAAAGSYSIKGAAVFYKAAVPV